MLRGNAHWLQEGCRHSTMCVRVAAAPLSVASKMLMLAVGMQQGRLPRIQSSQCEEEDAQQPVTQGVWRVTSQPVLSSLSFYEGRGNQDNNPTSVHSNWNEYGDICIAAVYSPPFCASDLHVNRLSEL